MSVPSISPDSLSYEITHALSARMRRSATDAQRLTPAQAALAWELFTLAESAPLLTLDTGQQRAAAATGVQTISLDG
jgi:hypothetical protein